MRSTFLSRTRNWIGASALAILVGLGGGTAFLVDVEPPLADRPGAAGRPDHRARRSSRPPALPISSMP